MILSFDVWSDFGFFKKPDVNKVSLTYNLPPKPAILGMIGGILGMGGLSQQYEINASDEQKKVFPEFYERLEHLKIGIKPIGDFPFNKIINTYNSYNSYFYDEEGKNKIVDEQLLIRPKYKIYVYHETKNELITELESRLKNSNPVFMPYLGKNEFAACFENIKATDNIKKVEKVPEHISSIFLIHEKNKSDKETDNDKSRQYGSNSSSTVKGLPTGFRFLESYPTDYSKDMYYNQQTVMYAEKNGLFSIDLEKGNIFMVDDDIVYLF